ncbi:hypothetical protein NPIL_196931 [Nephila pilipes]|uniref:Uncharacterized protein n=1 Tax=Nephila pilipes TaxID=299642 RepID=A0A8X6TS84_NEPPI|nr:hypothetical protein NPIL_196931 [Nephila pilipes]
MGSSSCLRKKSIAQNFGLNILPCKKDLYSFNLLIPVTQCISETIVDLQIGDVLGNNMYVLVLPNSTQPVDLLVGRPFLDLPLCCLSKGR